MPGANQDKMQVEIWSDVMCPFCYIGKRKFENALAQFSDRDEIDIVWKSFQLDPNQPTVPNKTVQQYLAERKGMSVQQAQQMTDHVTNVAKQAGLTFHFDKAVTANSFDAHRVSHLAKQNGLQNELEEQLFAAYFTDGRNTADHATLVQLGTDIGLDANEVKTVLQSDQYANDVQADIYEARQLGVQGVPFFVFNRKYAVSGAQESQTFLGALGQSYAEWKKAQAETVLEVVEGSICTTDGECV
ncbi:DsbA family oxidoreductase [Spirosoma validum]|uniref:DsbA family oxidoreductase n=1 Tax=Spirosoma validum TaxID=2771355 RepID=A0A927B6C4_9BACT|nr:DsbA family oxidoreductase [Spirosoma validum]MBD2756501.1 DsbA family oxidoreductase [Spirosoma validum]